MAAVDEYPKAVINIGGGSAPDAANDVVKTLPARMRKLIVVPGIQRITLDNVSIALIILRNWVSTCENPTDTAVVIAVALAATAATIAADVAVTVASSDRTEASTVPTAAVIS